MFLFFLCSDGYCFDALCLLLRFVFLFLFHSKIIYDRKNIFLGKKFLQKPQKTPNNNSDNFLVFYFLRILFLFSHAILLKIYGKSMVRFYAHKCLQHKSKTTKLSQWLSCHFVQPLLIQRLQQFFRLAIIERFPIAKLQHSELRILTNTNLLFYLL